MKCGCSTNCDCQSFPQGGQLVRNLNSQIDTLRQELASEQETVYCYIMTSIKNRHGHFVQTGCGPNFQGDLITLCTCRPDIRAYMDVDSWIGKWIAGFKCLEADENGNALVYLMKVAQAFESQYDFWFAATIPQATKQAKVTHLHECGDVYEPRSEDGDPFDPQHYIPPRADHVHTPGNRWHDDIDYVGHKTRHRAALLVGDPQYSFLWAKPMLFYPSQHPRMKKCELQALLGQL